MEQQVEVRNGHSIKKNFMFMENQMQS